MTKLFRFELTRGRKFSRVLFLASAAVLLGRTPLMAAPPSAIVLDVNAPNAKIQFMDYVEPNFIIDLDNKGKLSLGYLNSCIQESIEGGRVVIGRRQSTVQGGKVRRNRVTCNGEALELSADMREAGASVFRKPGNSASQDPNRSLLKIFGTSPVITYPEGVREIVIERINPIEDPIRIRVSGRFIDLNSIGKTLTPGGVYRVKSKDRSLMFQVDPSSKSGNKPILTRLIRLQN